MFGFQTDQHTFNLAFCLCIWNAAKKMNLVKSSHIWVRARTDDVLETQEFMWRNVHIVLGSFSLLGVYNPSTKTDEHCKEQETLTIGCQTGSFSLLYGFARV